MVELPEETLMYDRERHKALCLNRTSSLVWRRCDGQTTVEEMIAILAREMDVSPPTPSSPQLSPTGRPKALDSGEPLKLHPNPSYLSCPDRARPRDA